MSSAIGRSPVAAAPTAVLNVMCSAIGVSITRLRLYFLRVLLLHQIHHRMYRHL